MLSIHTHQRYYLYRQATDMRKGFNGLSGLVRDALQGDPLDGSAYIFINRRRDRMKLLAWEAGGFVLYYKLLESGTFELPRFEQEATSCSLTWEELMLIIQGVDLQSVRRRKRF